MDYSKKKERRLFLNSLILLYQRASSIVNFQSKKDGAHQGIVRKSLDKKGKESRLLKIQQRLVTSRVLQEHCHTARKEWGTQENKKKATEYAQLLAKRMKAAKENTRNIMPRDGGCPF